MAIRQGRTSIKGKHARPRRYKRVQYTYDFKLAVIQHYAFAASVDFTIVTFFSHVAPERRSSVRSLISKWRKMRATIEEQAGNARTAGHTRHSDVGTATVLGPGLEHDLVDWINNLRRDGIPTAWWNSDITVAWLEFRFGDRSPSDQPILLLLDSFSGHWTEDILAVAARLNVKLKAVPPKLTWRCQPADVAWIKPLKDCLRRKWVQHLRVQLAKRTDSATPFRMVSPSRYDVAEWIKAAWDGLTVKTVVSGFSKCGFRGPYRSDDDDTAPGEEDPDESELVDALYEAGAIGMRVGEVSDVMDVLDVNDSDEDDLSN